MKILCLTSIEYVPKIREILETCGEFIYCPDLDKKTTIEGIAFHDAEALFVNPNKMT